MNEWASYLVFKATEWFCTAVTALVNRRVHTPVNVDVASMADKVFAFVNLANHFVTFAS